MAVALPWIAAGFMAMVGVKQWVAGTSADKIGKANARAIKSEAAEEAFRLSDQYSRVRGKARAAAAASGFTLGGTNELYIEEMRTMQERELSWLTDAADRRAEIAKAQGNMAKDQAQAAAFASFASAASFGAKGLGGSTASGFAGQQPGGWGGGTWNV